MQHNATFNHFIFICIFVFYLPTLFFSKTTYEELKLLAYEKGIENISVLQTALLKKVTFFFNKSKKHYIKHETTRVIQFFFPVLINIR